MSLSWSRSGASCSDLLCSGCENFLISPSRFNASTSLVCSAPACNSTPMKRHIVSWTFGYVILLSLTAQASTPVPLFDGKTFSGWEGDTNQTWRIQDGEIVGGSLATNVPRNEFLCTTRPF